MVRILEFSAVPFENILKQIDIKFYEYDLSRCDERTLYVTIALSHNNKRVICDLIFLVDKQDLYGAISLNEKYDLIREFFKQQFNYDILYSDEQKIAHLVRQTDKFKYYLKQYATHYPKHVQSKFFN